MTPEIKEFDTEMPPEHEEPSRASASSLGRSALSYAGEEIVPQVVDEEYDRDKDPIGHGL